MEAKEFFRAMAKKYSGYLVEQEVPVVPASLESTSEESAPENSTQEDADVLVNVQIVETEEDDDYEDDDDNVEEHFKSRGFFRNTLVVMAYHPPASALKSLLPLSRLRGTITLNASSTVR